MFKGRFEKIKSLISDAASQDLPQIAHIHGKLFPRGWSVAEIEALSRQADCEILVAQRVGGGGREILGFNIIRKAADEAEILSIAVHDKYHRHGIAENLMRDAILRLRRDRITQLFLEVDATNAAAAQLYKKLGFQIVGTRPGYYERPAKPADRKPDGTGADDETKPKARSAALIMRLDLV